MCSKASIYPDELCNVIQKGFVSQPQKDNRHKVGQVGTTAAMDERDNELDDWVQCWGESSGQRLEPSRVQAAWVEEMRSVKGTQWCEKVLVQEC